MYSRHQRFNHALVIKNRKTQKSFKSANENFQTAEVMRSRSHKLSKNAAAKTCKSYLDQAHSSHWTFKSKTKSVWLTHAKRCLSKRAVQRLLAGRADIIARESILFVVRVCTAVIFRGLATEMPVQPMHGGHYDMFPARLWQLNQ